MKRSMFWDLMAVVWVILSLFNIHDATYAAKCYAVAAFCAAWSVRPA